jgi:hypothetical protein
MRTLIKWLFTLALLAGLVYVGFYVPFGKKTLYDHLVGISKTREAKTLGVEVDKKYKKTKKKLTKEIKKKVSDISDDASKTAKPVTKAAKKAGKSITESLDSDKPAEHSKKDQNALKELFKDKIDEIGADTGD